MNEIEKNRLERFVMDQVSVDAVYKLLFNSFLKSKGQRDVQIMAAERLAIDFLDDAWEELLKFKPESKPTAAGVKNPGL
ncbi:MAG: hypothetical protein V4469_04410 [Patescibacteria group bacterium]